MWRIVTKMCVTYMHIYLNVDSSLHQFKTYANNFISIRENEKEVHRNIFSFGQLSSFIRLTPYSELSHPTETHRGERN